MTNRGENRTGWYTPSRSHSNREAMEERVKLAHAFSLKAGHKYRGLALMHTKSREEREFLLASSRGRANDARRFCIAITSGRDVAILLLSSPSPRLSPPPSCHVSPLCLSFFLLLPTLLFEFPRTSVARRRDVHAADENTNQNSITRVRGFRRRGVPGVHLISIAYGTEALLFAGQIIARAPIGWLAPRDSWHRARAIAHCAARSCRAISRRISFSCKKIIARPSSWPYLNACQYYPPSRA